MRPAITLLAFTFLLTACGSVSRTSIEEQNRNPFTASRYGDELADTMANLIIVDDPILKEEGMRERIQEVIEEGKAIADEAREEMSGMMEGVFISLGQETAGRVLHDGEVLFLSSDFETDPGPSLHLYLTTAVDPRDLEFPDPTAIDLGETQSVYGAQTYDLPAIEDPRLYRTAVLWDSDLKRLWAFAQLAPHP